VHLQDLHVRKPVTHVVLSVGGNDVREILGHMDQLPTRVAAFSRNYPQILKTVLEVTPNVIIMLQYRPSFHQDSSYGVYRALARIGGGDGVGTLNALMEEVYPPVFKLAKQHNLALIDLSNTFDIYDTSMYKSQIEPSAKGGAVITHLIKHVVENHNFKSSIIYKMVGNSVIESNNESDWRIGNTSNMAINKMLRLLLQSGPSELVEVQDDKELILKIEQLRGMGFSHNVSELKQALSIDGTIETALSALMSNL